MKSILKYLVLLLIICTNIASQNVLELDKNIKWEETLIDKDYGFIRIGVDTIMKDSIVSSSTIYKRIAKNGIPIESIVDNLKCQCGARNYQIDSGMYREYYRSGELLKTGNLYCGQKINTWVEYYKSGQIKTTENFILLDPENQLIQTFRYGLKVDYHSNGRIKSKTEFTIVEQLDSFTIFDYEKYEAIDTCCNWQFKSIELDKRIEFDILGNQIKSKNIDRLSGVKTREAEFYEIFSYE